MTKYSIYKLTCETGKVYIGLTSRELSRRLIEHKSKDNTCCSKNFINPSIELLEEFETEDKIEKRKKEREYIDKFDCVNIKKEYRTQEEIKEDRKIINRKYKMLNPEKIKENKNKWAKNNKDKIREINGRAYEKNKDKINEVNREYYEKNKDKISEKRREYQKEFYEKNKDKKNEASREYYEKNKDKIKEKNRRAYEKNKDKISERRKQAYEKRKLKKNLTND